MKPFLFVLLCLLGLLTAKAQDKPQLSAKLQHAIDLFRSSDYVNAVSEFEAIRAARESTKTSEMYLGAVYVHLNRDDEARAAFKRVRMVSDKELLDPVVKNFRVIEKPKPNFQGIAGDKPGEYVIWTAVEFLANGKIGFVFEVEASSKDMLKRAKKSASRIKFVPATNNNTPVTVVRFVEYHYTFIDKT